MKNTIKRAEAVINLSHIEHNFREIKKFTENKKIICVIKADAYGHGARELGKLYEKLGADILAVACIDEALQLRAAGIHTPVLILGATPPEFAGTTLFRLYPVSNTHVSLIPSFKRKTKSFPCT